MDLFIHAGAEKQMGLWVGEGVSTLLFKSLFNTELLGFSSLQWDWMEGTVPSADKCKFQMVHDQRARPSPGTAWSRKQIVTHVDNLASDSGVKGKTYLVFKCKANNRNFKLQTDHFNFVGTCIPILDPENEMKDVF